jgi:CheY-like chemotaxis protein
MARHLLGATRLEMRSLRPQDALAAPDRVRLIASAAPSEHHVPDGSGPLSSGRPSGRAPRKVRIALAEADPKVREWLRQPLARLNAHVSEAESGPTLEALLQDEGPFDLVITDAQLPGGRSGLQVLARLRASGQTTPFIVVTSIQQSMLRVFISDAEGTVLSSRVVDPQNLVALASSLLQRVPPSGESG